MPLKSTNYPPYMYDDGDRGEWMIINPHTGKKKRFHDEERARKAAEVLKRWVDAERERKLLDTGRPTISGLVDLFMEDRLPFIPWTGQNRKNRIGQFKRIKRELGSRYVQRTDCVFLDDWLKSFCCTADTFNDWRRMLVLLWELAVSKKQTDTNEAEKILYRSTSKKFEVNQKVREPLDVDGFRAIHAKAEPFLQIAMEQSLITLQARNEICHTMYEHYRGGCLFVIRQKTCAQSDMAFIKITLTPELEDIRRRSLAMYGGMTSPFLVHRRPEKMRREWQKLRPHWTFVQPGYLSRAFQEARDATGLYKHLEPGQRPSFHEIRGLGSRRMRDRGVPEKDIQMLMTHSDRRATNVYLNGGADALTDDDYVAVTAPLTLGEMMR